MAKIFVVEDDENIRELIRVALTGYGYEVKTYENAEEALIRMDAERPSLSVFDLMLPGMDGLTAIKKIRENQTWRDMPVLILTAKDKEYDKVLGLDGGADDYLTKPFGVMELAARIRSLLRRIPVEEKEENSLSTGGLRIDFAKREVSRDGKAVELTYKEYELLSYLAKNPDRVVERDELLNNIWGYTSEVETRTLDIHIRTLRQKIGDEKGEFIKTIRGVGYRFIKEEE